MKIGVTAIGGRMGSEIATLVTKNPLLELKAALVRNKDGKHQFETNYTCDISELFKSCDAVIDFSSPTLSVECAKTAAAHGKILVCGTTGFNEDQKNDLIKSAQNSTIVWSSNMSIGANLIAKLVEKVSSLLHDDYDIDIIEMHHRNKLDSPSGTALLLGAAAASGRGIDFSQSIENFKGGYKSKRERNEIRFSSLRGGDVVGDHTVMFASDGERVELTHKASNRSIFASGAIRAAIWASNQKPGLYTMLDVLPI